jgi:hypothetical protein
VVNPVVDVVNPVVDPVVDVVNPVVDVVNPVVDPVVDVVNPVVDPVVDVVNPVVDPVNNAPISDTLISAPVPPGPVDDVTAPATAPATTLSPAPAVSAPAVGAGLDPVATEGVVPSATPVSQTAFPTPTLVWETNPSVGSSSLGSGPGALHSEQQGAPEGVLRAPLISTSQDDLAATGQVPVQTGILSAPRSIAANLSLMIGAGVAALGSLLDEAKGLLDRMPQSFPSAPAPAGSSSSSSSGGSGFQLLGALALLSILLLGGKHLWSAREFIKPSSALLPIIERPG